MRPPKLRGSLSENKRRPRAIHSGGWRLPRSTKTRQAFIPKRPESISLIVSTTWHRFAQHVELIADPDDIFFRNVFISLKKNGGWNRYRTKCVAGVYYLGECASGPGIGRRRTLSGKSGSTRADWPAQADANSWPGETHYARGGYQP